MGKFREQEGSSGFEEPEVSYEENIMHGFWLRLAVALATTFVWSIMGVRMSIHGITVNML